MQRPYTPKPIYRPMRIIPTVLIQMVFEFLNTIEHMMLENTCTEMKHVGATGVKWEEMQWRADLDPSRSIHEMWLDASHMFQRVTKHECSRILFHNGVYNPYGRLSHGGDYTFKELMKLVNDRRHEQALTLFRWETRKPFDLPERNYDAHPLVKTVTISVDVVRRIAALLFGYPNLETLVLAGVTSVERKSYIRIPASRLVVMCTRPPEVGTVEYIMQHMPNLNHLTLLAPGYLTNTVALLVLKLPERVTELTVNLEVLMALATSRIPKHLKKLNIARTRFSRNGMETIAYSILCEQGLDHIINIL